MAAQADGPEGAAPLMIMAAVFVCLTAFFAALGEAVRARPTAPLEPPLGVAARIAALLEEPRSHTLQPEVAAFVRPADELFLRTELSVAGERLAARLAQALRAEPMLRLELVVPDGSEAEGRARRLVAVLSAAGVPAAALAVGVGAGGADLRMAFSDGAAR